MCQTKRRWWNKGAVLLEEAVAQIVVEGRTPGVGQELREYTVVPLIAVGGGRQAQQPLRSVQFAPHRRDADDAILVREGAQFFAWRRLPSCRPCVRSWLRNVRCSALMCRYGSRS